MSSTLGIAILCPARPGSRYGNRITALRWRNLLRDLGCRVKIVEDDRTDTDLLIALHATKSSNAVTNSKHRVPDRPIIVVATGTDIYQHISSKQTQRSFDAADRIVVLQPAALNRLSSRQRAKATVIFQSALPVQTRRPAIMHTKRVVIAGHLRRVKDPLRAAMAARKLPRSSKIRIDHYGGVIESSIEPQVRHETEINVRYRWFGDTPRWRVRQAMAKSWLMVLSSKLEGGANVLTEAIVQHTVVLASRIDGSTGLLGDDYDGYFKVGNTNELRRLMITCEQDTDFYHHLKDQVIARSPLFHPDVERKTWRSLLHSLRMHS